MNISLNLLVTEDNGDDVFLLQQAFRKAGSITHLYIVNDGVDAQASLKGEGEFSDRTAHPFPDALLLDLNMPRLNSFELLEWIREDDQCRRLVVHVQTASAREADINRAYELGATNYIVKPSRVDELVSLVTVLHQWHQVMALPRKPQLSIAFK